MIFYLRHTLLRIPVEKGIPVPDGGYSQNLLVSRIKKGEMYEPPVPKVQEVAGSDPSIIFDTNEYPVTVFISEDEFTEISDECEYYGLIIIKRCMLNFSVLLFFLPIE